MPRSDQHFLDLTPTHAEAKVEDAHLTPSAIAALEATHPWFRSRAALITWAMRRFCKEAGSFLDVGCGTGLVLQHLSRRYPDLSLSGGDPSIESLRCAEGRVPRATLFLLDARSLPFDSEFDAVGAFDVLEHIHDDRTVLSQMRQAVRPGGSLLLTVPQHPFLWSPFDEYSGHVRRYTRRGLASRVREAGWEVVYTTSFVSLFLPALSLSRVLLRGSLRKEPLREMHLPGPLGGLARAALRGERLLIERGVRFPAGSSRLLVARRPEAGNAEG
jgi:SAM-dependent methyltransferase